jgi:hypothetical protein
MRGRHNTLGTLYAIVTRTEQLILIMIICFVPGVIDPVAAAPLDTHTLHPHTRV